MKVDENGDTAVLTGQIVFNRNSKQDQQVFPLDATENIRRGETFMGAKTPLVSIL